MCGNVKLWIKLICAQGQAAGLHWLTWEEHLKVHQGKGHAQRVQRSPNTFFSGEARNQHQPLLHISASVPKFLTPCHPLPARCVRVAEQGSCQTGRLKGSVLKKKTTPTHDPRNLPPPPLSSLKKCLFTFFGVLKVGSVSSTVSRRRDRGVRVGKAGGSAPLGP